MDSLDTQLAQSEIRTGPWNNLGRNTLVNKGTLLTAIHLWSQRIITPEEVDRMRKIYALTSWFDSPELSPIGKGGTGEPPELALITSVKCILKFKDMDGEVYPLPMIMWSEFSDGEQRMMLGLNDRVLCKGDPRKSFLLSSDRLVAPIEVMARADRVLRTLGEERHENDIRVTWKNPRHKQNEFSPDIAGSVWRITREFGQTPKSFGRALWLASNTNLELKF